MQIKNIACLLILLTGLNTHAENYFVFAEGGRGTADIKADYTVDGIKSSNKNTMVTLGGGILFESRLIVGIERTESSTDNFFGADDRYQFDQNKLFVGYRIPVATHFRIVPIIGTSQWEIQAKSGALFTAPTPKTGTYKGNDIYGQINLEFPISHLVTVVTSFNNSQFNFGSVRSAQAGVSFQF